MNPWYTIWTQPRKTVQWMAENAPGQWLWLLVFCGGVSRVLTQLPGFPVREAFPDFPAGDLVMVGIVLGPVAGAFQIYVIGRLVHLVLTKYMGGTGSWTQTRTAIAWSFAPGAASTLLWFVMLATHGPEVAISQPSDYPSLVVTLDHGLHFVFTVWMVVLEVLCIAYVHRIILWRVVLAEIGVSIGVAVVLTILMSLVVAGLVIPGAGPGAGP